MLPLSYYRDPDVVTLSRDLLGKMLITNIGGGGCTSGIIVETEAYGGIEDRACHAHARRFTDRTRIMYEPGGVGYVYLIYGIYHMFNIITSAADDPKAVLIRAIEPVDGVDTMLYRRGMEKLERRLTAGPGLVTQALGITKAQNGVSLISDEIWLEDTGMVYGERDIIASPRVGIDYAGEDALLPWRFRVKENKCTSPAK